MLYVRQRADGVGIITEGELENGQGCKTGNHQEICPQRR